MSMPGITIQGLKAGSLKVDEFSMAAGEAWCIIGTLGSGIELFFDIVAGQEIRYSAQLLELPDDLGVLSFAGQQELFELEMKKDDTDYMGRVDPGTPASDFLLEPDRHADLIEAFDMQDSLDKGYRQLSSGQSRKLLLLGEITKGVSYLLLQHPYEGLDAVSCRVLNQSLASLSAYGVQVLITVSNLDDIPDWCTNLAYISRGRLAVQGETGEVYTEICDRFHNEEKTFCVTGVEVRGETETYEVESSEELVRLTGGRAGYGGEPVFSGLDLMIRTGEHTLITGPNGCGKSTLVQLITGDHPQCYGNDLKIFGVQRGSGESIWELKSQMGIVSSDLHRNHYIPGSCLHIVISGFFDSIGLYRQANRSQTARARTWLTRLGLTAKASTPFRRLSYGQQRLVLIARALIKVPRLLILDEPTQGLDGINRSALLDFLEEIAIEQLCTVVYVSHRQDEFRSFFKQHIDFTSL